MGLQGCQGNDTLPHIDQGRRLAPYIESQQRHNETKKASKASESVDQKVPDEVVEKLRQRAKSHHRSLQGELLVIVEEAVRDRPLSAAEVLQQARELGLGGIAPKGSIAELRIQVQKLGLQTTDESTAWIRADRDAR